MMKHTATANKTFKVLLVYLPLPQFLSEVKWGGTPLALGYLKAMAYKAGLLDKVAIEILSIKETNQSSDSKLIDLIISKSPDAIGFSLYMWNSVRSIFIMEEIKKRMPKTKIIVGGPEVALDSKYILNNPAIDIGCLGEGELVFIDILKNLFKDKDDYANTNGIFYRKSGKLIVNPSGESIRNLDEIPSPFELGYIDLQEYDMVTIEATRGCSFKCNYCVVGLRSMRHFSVKRVCNDIKIILGNGIKRIRFADSDFMANPDFHEICAKIIKINKNRRLQFSSFAHADSIDNKRIKLLKKCNFSFLEIGLQTINRVTLKNIQRAPLDTEKFISCLRSLEEKNIDYIIDVMIGLPVDTSRDIKKTLRFLKDNKINKVEPFLLSILPGTALRKEASKYGIKFQKKPPYFIIEAPYISKNEIKKLITPLVKDKRRPRFRNLYPYFGEYLYNYCDINHSGLKKKNFGNFFENAHLTPRGIRRVIIELDDYRQDDQLRIAGEKISRLIEQPFVFWFKTQDLEKSFSLVKSLILPIASANPFLIWNIVLEAGSHFSREMLEKIIKNIHTKEKISELLSAVKPLSICAIFPWQDDIRVRIRRINSVKRAIPFFWSLDISKEYNWRKAINGLLTDKDCAGLLIDFDKDFSHDFIEKVLKFILKKQRTFYKPVFFRNIVTRCLELNLTQQRKRLGRVPINRFKRIDSILSLDRNLNISSATKSGDEIMADLTVYQMQLNSILQSKNGA